ncbi:MAG: protein translocase subunit SecDF [Candidatus Omnitrophica bacterium CG22_combo_CG10-13_8_21_14_all_43_16]|nr:MAG: protein translocase subunit SecDF [Candidatus Omnitrophica bacterium CG22_combo_CG10-13_8_21_14_all_43_16]
MTKNLQGRIALALGVLVFALVGMLPLKEKINLGLDLQGGMHLLLKVDTSGLPEEAKEDAPLKALEIIRNRIDEFGVKELSVYRQGTDEIVVQLPGVTDRDRARELIGKTALLEFKLVEDSQDLYAKALEGQVPDGYELKDVDKEKILLNQKTLLTGDTLVNAEVKFDQSRFNEPYVAIEFNAKGSSVFSEITGANTGKRLAIVLDGKVHSAPRINERIPSGKASITGRFTVEEASDLAIILRAGTLPAPIYIEEERTVGPLLGRDSINSGIRASLIGLILIFIFMVVYYLFAGMIASFAMLLNFVIILGTLGWIHTTLTLPGIAGMILTIGMAVDANVLIFERMREEMATGKHMRSVISFGYDKAYSAILDSNITTLIAAALLFQFGSGPIKGFGVTLSIGLMASMFTGIFVTRIIFELISTNKNFTKLPMLKLFPKTNIDFIAKRWIAYTLSIIVLLAGLGTFIMRGEKMYGIDFTGGQIQEYSFSKHVSTEDVRKIIDGIGVKDATIQQFVNKNQVLIKTSLDEADKIGDALKTGFQDNPYELLRVEKVGPSVGKLLKKNALLALIWSLAGILIYVGIRFKNMAFAAAGVLALFHDVFIGMGALAMAGGEMDLNIIAALLTIAGYSVNDTIVIYDRIRENLKLYRKASMKEIVNMSVNQTLSRTVITTFMTLLAVVSIFLFGGEVLRPFSFVLLAGMISGVYSTVFIASPLLISWHSRQTK